MISRISDIEYNTRFTPNIDYLDLCELCKVGEEAGGGGYPVKEMDEMELEAGLSLNHVIV